MRIHEDQQSPLKVRLWPCREVNAVTWCVQAKHLCSFLLLCSPARQQNPATRIIFANLTQVYAHSTLPSPTHYKHLHLASLPACICAKCLSQGCEASPPPPPSPPRAGWRKPEKPSTPHDHASLVSTASSQALSCVSSSRFGMTSVVIQPPPWFLKWTIYPISRPT